MKFCVCYTIEVPLRQKKAKIVAKGLLSHRIKQRNVKKKVQAMKDKKRNRFERYCDAPSKTKRCNAAAESGSKEDVAQGYKWTLPTKWVTLTSRQMRSKTSTMNR